MHLPPRHAWPCTACTKGVGRSAVTQFLASRSLNLPLGPARNSSGLNQRSQSRLRPCNWGARQLRPARVARAGDLLAAHFQVASPSRNQQLHRCERGNSRVTAGRGPPFARHLQLGCFAHLWCRPACERETSAATAPAAAAAACSPPAAERQLPPNRPRWSPPRLLHFCRHETHK